MRTSSIYYNITTPPSKHDFEGGVVISLSHGMIITGVTQHGQCEMGVGFVNSVVNQFITDDYVVRVSKFLINNLPQRLFVLVEKVG